MVWDLVWPLKYSLFHSTVGTVASLSSHICLGVGLLAPLPMPLTV